MVLLFLVFVSVILCIDKWFWPFLSIWPIFFEYVSKANWAKGRMLCTDSNLPTTAASHTRLTSCFSARFFASVKHCTHLDLQLCTFRGKQISSKCRQTWDYNLAPWIWLRKVYICNGLDAKSIKKMSQCGTPYWKRKGNSVSVQSFFFIFKSIREERGK